MHGNAANIQGELGNHGVPDTDILKAAPSKDDLKTTYGVASDLPSQYADNVYLHATIAQEKQ